VGLACPSRTSSRPSTCVLGRCVLREAREPTNEGFAGPGSGDSHPCSPFAGFRIRVSVFDGAWRTQTLDRLLGPGNRHKGNPCANDILPRSGHRDAIPQESTVRLGKRSTTPVGLRAPAQDGRLLSCYSVGVGTAQRGHTTIAPLNSPSTREDEEWGAVTLQHCLEAFRPGLITRASPPVEWEWAPGNRSRLTGSVTIRLAALPADGAMVVMPLQTRPTSESIDIARSPRRRQGGVADSVR
jgi:hypothetical protein